jgi:hypothetical protein
MVRACSEALQLWTLAVIAVIGRRPTRLRGRAPRHVAASAARLNARARVGMSSHEHVLLEQLEDGAGGPAASSERSSGSASGVGGSG